MLAGNEKPSYSVVIPFHNEQDNIRELHQKLSEVVRGKYEPIEFVFVDDQSTDATPQILREVAGADPRVVVIRLKRNYGQTIALAAGFDYATGDTIISMDGDLQHDPADLPALITKLQESGVDLVSGWRKTRADNLLLRQFPSRVANWLIAKMSGVGIHDFGTTFKVYRREVIKQVRLYGEMHRFIPALAAWNGAKIAEVPIRDSGRRNGRSHYGLSRTFRVIFDMLTVRFLLRYVTRPLHFFGPLGLLGIFAGFLIAGSLAVEKILYHTDLFQSHGPLMIFAVVLFLGGVQLITSGLLAELISRTYFESQRKAIYLVESVLQSENITAHP